MSTGSHFGYRSASSFLIWSGLGLGLTAYGGESSDLPPAVLQRYLDRIASGELSLGPIKPYSLEQIRQAHDDMEHNRAVGKQVVVL